MSEAYDPDEIKREREAQREHQRHMAQLQFDSGGRLSREFIESLINTDKLQSQTVELMRNYLDRNWMLANLTEAEAHDQRFKLDVMQIKILGQHPPQESSIVGPIRAFLFDDEQEDLMPLTAAERNVIDSFFDSLKAIVTRGRGGFERKLIQTEVRESKTESSRERGKKSGGRFKGLFG